MLSTEMWENFVLNEVLVFRKGQLHALHEYFVQHKDELALEIAAWCEPIWEYILHLQQEEQLKRLDNIAISLMRTSLLSGSWSYIIELNVTPESAEQSTTFCYEASWIRKYWNDWILQCEQARRAYMGKMPELLLEQLIAAQVYPFHVYMVHAMRYAMDTIRKQTSFKALNQGREFEIRVGEYRNKEISESVYRYKQQLRSSDSCKGWLESRIPDEYIYEHIADVDLTSGQFNELSLNNTRFERVNLSHSLLRGCLLLDTQFEECQLIEADLEESKIIDANFSYCKLQGASFNYCEGGSHIESEKYGIFLGIHGVNFKYADLRGATFRYARIAGDFRYAQLAGVDLTGADLRGSKMLIADRDQIKLTQVQQDSIEWVGRE